jgi:predicted nuclease with RNAse H fold
LTPSLPLTALFIGWDVGGWNCDHNPNSRDALAILDAQLALVGRPWRGNLREAINQAASAAEFIRGMLDLCAAPLEAEAASVALAIDTPLGFSDEFVKLISRGGYAEPVGESATNLYLYRQTERYLFAHGLRPLSPVKDMIGSQATKGMHVLAKFAPQVVRCGVWSDGERLTVIEAYPSACKRSAVVANLRQQVARPPDLNQDEMDALTCALVACLYSQRPKSLIPPAASVPANEGWIWVPGDILEGQA